MKTIIESNYQFIESVTHQNKVFVFVIKKDADKNYSEIYYSLQDPSSPFESSEKKNMTTVNLDESWRPFDKLNFPTWIRPVGMRLGAYRVEGFDERGDRNTTVVYTEEEYFSVTSDGVTITIFRKVDVNKTNPDLGPEYKIFADRFVYNTKMRRLYNVNEVRYIRSGSPDVPQSQLDTFGVTNPSGIPFIEPTSEIGLENITDFRFDVVSIPVKGKLYNSVWHFFVYERFELVETGQMSNNTIQVYSIPRSTSILFDTSFCKIAEQSTNILPTLQLDPASEDMDGIFGIGVDYYLQQESTVNSEGQLITIKKGAHVSLVVNQGFVDMDTSGGISIDFEVGHDGFLAGMNNETYDTPHYLISHDDLSFYGTALQLDGRNDSVYSGEITSDGISYGLSISIWANIKNDYSKPFSRNFWTLNNIKLEDSDDLVTITLNYNHIGRLELVITSDEGATVFDLTNVPSFEFNRWNNFILTIPESDYSTLVSTLVINDFHYNLGSLGLKFEEARASQFSIGTRLDQQPDTGFQGLLSEVRLNFLELQISMYQIFQALDVSILSETSREQMLRSTILCEAFNEGSGSELTSYLAEDNDFENLVNNFEVYGGVWVPSIIGSRQNMKVQYYDEKLLKCTSATLSNSELQNTAAPCRIEPFENLSMLDSSDGTLRTYYTRNNSEPRHMGVVHFDTMTTRFRNCIFWQEDAQDTNYMLLPKIIFTALIVGSDMNDAVIQIKWQEEAQGSYYCIRAYKEFISENGETIIIDENWRNLVASKNPTALDIVSIVNGVSDLIDYESNFVRYTTIGNGSRISTHKPYPSMLFHGKEITKENEDNQQYFPLDGSMLIKEQTKTRFSFGIDSTWVHDPVPPALYLQKNAGSYVKISDIEFPLKDFSLESWINIANNLNPSDDTTFSYIYQCKIMERLLLICSMDNAGKLYFNLDSQITNNRNIRNVSDNVVITPDIWQHLALTYRTGYALNFQDNLYVDFPNDKSLDIENALTIEGWYFIPENNMLDQLSSENDYQIIMSKWDERENESSWRLMVNSDRQLGFELIDDDKNNFKVWSAIPDSGSAPPTQLNVGTWNHVAAQYAKPSKHNMMCIDETDGDIHFDIPAFSNQWSDVMTIEFETAIDNNTEVDYFTFISYYYYSTSDSKNKNFVSIMRDNNENLVIKFLGEKATFDKPFTFILKELTHLALTINILEDVIKLNLYINGESYGECSINNTSSLKSTINGLKTDETNVHKQSWLIGSSIEDGNKARHFSGYLSNIRIWDKLRTQQQIIDYLNIVSIDYRTNGLLALYPLNQSPNFSPIDAHDFSITNMVDDISIKPYCETSGKGVSWEGLPISGKFNLLINGALAQNTIVTYNGVANSSISNKICNSIFVSKVDLSLGKQASGLYSFLEGKLDNVRIWNTYRLPSQIDYYKYNNLTESIITEKNMEVFESLVAYWTFDEGKGTKVIDHGGKHEGTIKGMDILEDEDDDLLDGTWVPSTFNGKLKVFIDGDTIPSSPSTQALIPTTNIENRLILGSYSSNNFPDIEMKDWYIGEVRLWDKVIRSEKIKSNLNSSLSGNEVGLVGYWKCNDGSGVYLLDSSKNKVCGRVDHFQNLDQDSIIYWIWINDGTLAYPIPVSNDSQLCINGSNNVPTRKSESIPIVGDITATEFNNFQQLFLGYFEDDDNNSYGQLNLGSESNAGENILVYVGQAQYNPRIVGFIEGAPPVPSENLSVDDPTNPDKYVGASMVTFGSEGEVNTNVSNGDEKSKQIGREAYFGGAFSYDVDVAAGTPFALNLTNLSEMESNIYIEGGDSRESTSEDTKGVSVGANAQKEYSLTLGGSWEPNIYNLANVPSNRLYIQPSRLYRPNNMGLAVVKSRTVDLYAIQNSITKKTIGYKPVLDPKIPEDTNYIMFRINPEYIKNGSLDGRIGFDTDTQYPDLDASQKASFYKAQEAYQLQSKIDREQEEWKNTLSQTEISTNDPVAKSKELSLVNNYLWTADGGFYVESKQFTAAHIEQHDTGLAFNSNLTVGVDNKMLFGIDALFGFEIKGSVMTDHSHTTTTSVEDTSSGTFSLEVEAEGEGFLSMQADMWSPDTKNIPCDDAQYAANKNSLNTGYDDCVAGNNPTFWDALNTQGIIEKNESTFEKFIVIQTGHATWNLANSSKEYMIEGIPDFEAEDNVIRITNRTEPHLGQYPILFQADNCPGKVTSYRFKSFYIHAGKENFDVLKEGDNGVPIIDPDWLSNTDNPDAVAMSQALENPNSIWRIFHRVTYVSRVPPNNDIAPQLFESGPMDLDANNLFIDYTAQAFTKPDPISIANNYLLIKTIMGNAGIPGYVTIDQSAPDFENLKLNINFWITENTDDFQLDGVEKERLFYMMFNYFNGYLLPDDE